jgi:uncharacterized protein (TIGR00288 family)
MQFNSIALLIDAENITSKHITKILESLASFGTVSVRRIYADWTDDHVKSWKEIILESSLNPIHQYSYSQGKNSTDSAMIIDAMDLLHKGNFDCFALVSSDSDFTKLAQRIREDSKYVVGLGEEKTPSNFRKACNEFIILRLSNAKVIVAKDTINEIERLILQGFEKKSDEDGWCDMAALAGYLKQVKPDFSAADDLGKKKFSDYFKSQPERYEIKKEKKDGPGSVYVRIRP